jgi:hypothetical protein
MVEVRACRFLCRHCRWVIPRRMRRCRPINCGGECSRARASEPETKVAPRIPVPAPVVVVAQTPDILLARIPKSDTSAPVVKAAADPSPRSGDVEPETVIAPIETRTFEGAGQNVPRARVTRKGNLIFYVASYTRNKDWYTFVDTKGAKRTQLASSIERIEDLTPAEAFRLVAAPPEELSPHATRVPTGPRVAARTRYRSAARQDLYAAQEAMLNQSMSNIGYTPTGIPMHMGPRGGIYHISSGGNKVYHP